MGGLYSVARQERRGLNRRASHAPDEYPSSRAFAAQLLVLRLQLAFTTIAESIKALPRVGCRCRLPRHEFRLLTGEFGSMRDSC